MSLKWTTINQRQWPVPLPNGISLDHLRSELLEFGAEYVQSEFYLRLRRDEWKLDVPTIGNIYRAALNIVPGWAREMTI